VADRTEGNGVQPDGASNPVRRRTGTMPTRWADALRRRVSAVPAGLIPPRLGSSGPALLSGPGVAGGSFGALLSTVGPLPPPSAPAPCVSRDTSIGMSTASLRSRLPPVLSILRTVRPGPAVLSRNVGNERYRRQREGGNENEKHRNGRSWRKHMHGEKTVGNAAYSADGVPIWKISATIFHLYSRDDARPRHGRDRTVADDEREAARIARRSRRSRRIRDSGFSGTTTRRTSSPRTAAKLIFMA